MTNWDWCAGWASLTIMLWTEFGYPANVEASFAFGLGLGIYPLTKLFLESVKGTD